MDDILQEFIAETREMLGAIAGEIVAWEADPADRGRLDEIFRFVHTVKGSCGFLNLPRIERLSHAAEETLATLRDGGQAVNARQVSAVLAIIDRIGQLVDAIESGESLPQQDEDRLLAALAGGEALHLSHGDTHRAVSRTIRLPIDLLDRMMSGVSDMVLARNDLSRRLRDSGGDGAIEAAFERLSLCVAEMRDAITRTRMQRIDNIFTTLPRLVRDLSADLDKKAAIEVDGGDVELDREMIEMIRDPLTHIIRNAVDHGIEPPAERRAAGKPAAGRIEVRACQAGNQILIEIADDGRGIDTAALVARAIAARVVTPDQAARLGRAQTLALIFEPGLSTAKAVTSVSGRGVGMDVVRSNVERIGGLVEIESQPGLGTRLVLRVPLTLTIIPALTVSAGGQRFAIPRSAIEEIVRARGADIRLEAIGGGLIAGVRGQRIPVVALDRLIEAPARDPAILVILRPAGGESFALAIDEVHDHEELVVKPASPAVMATGLYAGTTLPDSGEPMLLLDPAGIAELAGVHHQAMAPAPEAADTPHDTELARVPTLLFRDLCGAERAIRLAIVERIEDVAGSAIHLSAGRLRLVHEGRILPLLTCGAELGERARVRILRLSDGAAHLAYAIDEVIDIIALPECGVPPTEPGLVAGIVLVDDRPVELLDPHWLFAQVAGDRPADDTLPLCLLAAGDDNWTREILRPLVEAAGYRVALAGPGEATPDIVVDSGAGLPEAIGPHVPVVRLRGARNAAPGEEGSIYRYDREGLIAALRTQRRKG